MSKPYIMLCSTKNQSYKDWLETRRLGIGGSDAGAICGLNKYSSPLSVYLDKLGLLPEKEETEPMRFGKDLEDYVAKRFEEQTGKKVRKLNKMLQHTEHTFMLANVDRVIVGENALLECKTASDMISIDSENPNPSYYAQCQHYMAVMGCSVTYLAVYQRSTGLHVIEIKRDEKEIEALIEIERDFWFNHVLAKIPPEVDGSMATSDMLSVLYPKAVKECKLLYALDDKLKQIDSINASISELEKEKLLLTQEIKAEMGEASEGISHNYIVSWTNRKGRTKLDEKRLKQEMPQIYEKFKTETADTRVFKIKTAKSEGMIL